MRCWATFFAAFALVTGFAHGGAVPSLPEGPTFWVAPSPIGDDSTGDGSAAAPWATLTHAVDNVPDGSLVLVRPGTYNGQQRLRQSFTQGVTVRSEVPYRARLRHDDRVIVAYTARGITIEGFDIAHSGAGAAALVIHIQDLIDGADFTGRITLRNNVIHDSWNNDLLKVNNGAGEVTIEGNLFYNQTGSDEHIDANSVFDVVIRDNVFFNDFEGSGRPNGNDTSSFIVIKDSNAGDDGIIGSRRIDVQRNVFLHWQGSTGSNFVLIGEDGQSFFEAEEVTVENNLMLGDANHVMRASVGVKGGRDIVFRHNTVSGDLPALAFAMRLNREGANPANEMIDFFGNLWSDPTGSMGSTGTGSNDFSDTPPADTLSFTLDGNLYWNGGVSLPEDPGELINPSDDPSALVGDPRLRPPTDLVLPRWDSSSGRFADGSATIAEVHRRLALRYALPAAGSPALDGAEPTTAPGDDLLGRPRTDGAPDHGALERQPGDPTFQDGFESGDTAAWSATVPLR